MKIYFVCTGNICRSSFAHWYCQKKVDDLQLDDLSVASFGTGYDPGLAVPDEALEVAEEFEVDLSRHVPSPMTDEVLHADALYFVMERKHAEFILRRKPDLQGNVKMLGDYQKDPVNGVTIADPWRKPSQYYRVCYRQISLAIDKLLLDLA